MFDLFKVLSTKDWKAVSASRACKAILSPCAALDCPKDTEHRPSSSYSMDRQPRSRQSVSGPSDLKDAF